jgi:hypothetical protein
MRGGVGKEEGRTEVVPYREPEPPARDVEPADVNPQEEERRCHAKSSLM